jgi:lysyl-tRNA synthetase class II
MAACGCAPRFAGLQHVRFVHAPEASSGAASRYPCRIKFRSLAGSCRVIAAQTRFRTGSTMHRYRTHTCGALRDLHIGETVRLSGWCHRIRDHGGLLFIDLRDHYGLTQCVADPDSPAFAAAEKLHAEWVVRVDGLARRRPAGTENPDLPTGAVEVFITDVEVLGPAGELPMPVFGEADYPEETRLKYRFLDLRRERLHRNIMKRGAIIDSIRRRMKEQGFFEFQTPILTASSPEGCRRRRSSSSSSSWFRASIAISRSPHAFAMRTPAPTARPASSTSSTSR